jgi:hypothetical protein
MVGGQLNWSTRAVSRPEGDNRRSVNAVRAADLGESQAT